ncbi:MAG: hypothetical protein JWQ88_301 [Rhodoferax sp.]|nr:hypothetical protein [Rhodoferax sp.]
MHRRKFLVHGHRAALSAALGTVFGTAFRTSLGAALVLGAAGQPALAQPRYTVSAAQMQAAVAAKFPLDYPVAGLFTLALQAPRLRLLPAENRIHADIPVEAAGEALRRRYPGNLDLDFALRYEPSDRSLRAHAIRVNALQFPGLRPEVGEMLNTYAPVLAAQALREVVLHELTDKDLALADTMGLAPDRITVTASGLVIDFKNR